MVAARDFERPLTKTSSTSIDLDRSTLAAWVGKSAFELRPVLDALVADLKPSSKGRQFTAYKERWPSKAGRLTALWPASKNLHLTGHAVAQHQQRGRRVFNVSHGPDLPLPIGFRRGSAARETGLSLRLRKQEMGEFTQCRTKPPFPAWQGQTCWR